MQKESVDGIIHPQKLEAAPRKRTAVDGGALGVGNEPAAGDPPDDALLVALDAEAAEIDVDEVAGPGVDGHAIAPAGSPGAAQLGFVIAGEQPFGPAVAGGQVRPEPVFEEPPRGAVVAPVEASGRGTDGPPMGHRASDAAGAERPPAGKLAETSTGPYQGRHGGAVRVLPPTGKPVEGNRRQGQLPGRGLRWFRPGGFRLGKKRAGTEERSQRQRRQRRTPNRGCPWQQGSSSGRCFWCCGQRSRSRSLWRRRRDPRRPRRRHGRGLR